MQAKARVAQLEYELTAGETDHEKHHQEVDRSWWESAKESASHLLVPSTPAKTEVDTEGIQQPEDRDVVLFKQKRNEVRTSHTAAITN